MCIVQERTEENSLTMYNPLDQYKGRFRKWADEPIEVLTKVTWNKFRYLNSAEMVVEGWGGGN